MEIIRLAEAAAEFARKIARKLILNCGSLRNEKILFQRRQVSAAAGKQVQ